MTKKTEVIIFAAGRGTRMQSGLPKVLHLVSGVSLIERSIKAAKRVNDEPIVVVGYGSDLVESVISTETKRRPYQGEQLGTGQALKVGLSEVDQQTCDVVVAINGDHPFTGGDTLRALSERIKARAKVALGTVTLDKDHECYAHFNHYGRLQRNSVGVIESIVEFKDATVAQLESNEFNIGMYAFETQWLFENINKLTTNNKASEYYIVDLIGLAAATGDLIETIAVPWQEGLGVNSPEELERANELAQNM